MLSFSFLPCSTNFSNLEAVQCLTIVCRRILKTYSCNDIFVRSNQACITGVIGTLIGVSDATRETHERREKENFSISLPSRAARDKPSMSGLITLVVQARSSLARTSYSRFLISSIEKFMFSYLKCVGSKRQF